MAKFDPIPTVGLNDFVALEKCDHDLQEMIMPIVATGDSQVFPLGTGFVISHDGLLMTAKHVIEEHLAGMACNRESGDLYEVTGLYAMYISKEVNSDNSNFGGLWPIQYAWYSKELDIAFCWLQKMFKNNKPYTFSKLISLSPGLPQVGQNIMGFGYHKSKSDNFLEINPQKASFEYKHEPCFTSGRVKTIYHVKRDSFNLNFPCFETDARFAPGMSGGPIFDGATGGVCGVICSSFSGDEADGYISYVSMIWPALGTSIQVASEDDPVPKDLLIYDLCKQGYIKTDASIEDIEVIVGENNTRTIKIKNNLPSIQSSSC